MKTKGRYFKSEKEYTAITGGKVDRNSPCIHVSGSIRGMRKCIGDTNVMLSE